MSSGRALILILMLVSGTGVLLSCGRTVGVATPATSDIPAPPEIVSPYDDDVFVERRISLPSGAVAVVTPAYRRADDPEDQDTPSLAFVISVLDGAGAMVLQPVGLGVDFNLELLPEPGDTPYSDQSLIVQEQDFNFDGHPDILINQGPMGCYGGTLFRYFLSTADGGYRNHPGLDGLADRHCLITPETETGLIMTIDPRDGPSFLYTWYRCDQSSCEKTREVLEESEGS